MQTNDFTAIAHIKPGAFREEVVDAINKAFIKLDEKAESEGYEIAYDRITVETDVHQEDSFSFADIARIVDRSTALIFMAVGVRA